MREITRAELIRDMFLHIEDICAGRLMNPFDVLHGGKRKGQAIVQARMEFINAIQAAYVQWQEKGVWKFGHVASGEDAVPKSAIPISTVILGEFTGLDHSSIVQARKRVAKEHPH